MGWLEDLEKEGLLGSTTDESAFYVSVFLMGDFGTGKTRFISTCKKPLLLNFDQGDATLTALKCDVPRINFPSGKKVYKLINSILTDAKNKTGPFAPDGKYADIETICIDSVTAMGKALLYEILKYERTGVVDPLKIKPEYDDWSFLGSRLQDLFRTVRELPYHVVVTATLTIDEAKDKPAIGFPDIPGKFRCQVSGYFDEVYIMTKRKGRPGEKEVMFETHTNQHQLWTGKSRWGVPSKITELEFGTLEKLLQKSRKEGPTAIAMAED